MSGPPRPRPRRLLAVGYIAAASDIWEKEGGKGDGVVHIKRRCLVQLFLRFPPLFFGWKRGESAVDDGRCPPVPFPFLVPTHPDTLIYDDLMYSQQRSPPLLSLALPRRCWSSVSQGLLVVPEVEEEKSDETVLLV